MHFGKIGKPRTDEHGPPTGPYDSAAYIDSPEAVAAYPNAALEDGDPQVIASTLGDIARSKGTAMIADRTGLARDALYKSLSAEGNPRLTTLVSVLKSNGPAFVDNR